jgi:hypothetical protein
MYRAYNPVLGRWLSRDRLGEQYDVGLYTYCFNSPFGFVDPFGLSGFVTIYSNGGHAWISFAPDGSSAGIFTYGTWGNHPDGRPNGLESNLERGLASEASRTMHISDEQEQKMMNKIVQYSDMGQDAWLPGFPCSGFAADVWQSATDEDLNAYFGPVNNPYTLEQSIIQANDGVRHNTATAPYAGNSGFNESSRPSGSSVNSLRSSF